MLSNSAFETEHNTLPHNPIIQYIKLINVIIGDSNCIADKLVAPIKKLTITESTNKQIFPAIDVNSVGRKNSLNL